MATAASPLDVHAEASTSILAHRDGSRSAGDGNGVAKPITPRRDSGDMLDQSEGMTDVLCGGCSNLINEDSAQGGVIHFATQLWHLECFRCAKCSQPVSTDRDDILLLSDGHPICAGCNYSCQICGLPILEEAIMTGDESYHATCFTCRSCKDPIKELVFAKTSQGIYCMPCHSERVARSRRHSEARRKSGKHRNGSSRKSKLDDTQQDSPGAPPPLPRYPPPSEPSTSSLTTSASLGPDAEEASVLGHQIRQEADQTLRPGSSALQAVQDETALSMAYPRASTPSRQASTPNALPSTPLLNQSSRVQSQQGIHMPLPSSPAQAPTTQSFDALGSPSARFTRDDANSSGKEAGNLRSSSSRPSTADCGKNANSPLPQLPPEAHNATGNLEAMGAPDEVDASSCNRLPTLTTARTVRRSSDSDAGPSVSMLRTLNASESVPNQSVLDIRREAMSELGADEPSSPSAIVMAGRTTPTPYSRDSGLLDGGTRGDKDPVLGSPLRSNHSPWSAGVGSPGLSRSPPPPMSRASRFSSSSGTDPEASERSAMAQVKRASRMSFLELPSQTSALHRQFSETSAVRADDALTEAFSFYNADFAKLMDTIDDVSAVDTASQMSSPLRGDAPLVIDEPDSGAETLEQRGEHRWSNLVPNLGAAALRESYSGSSMNTIQARMRESMRQAHDGQVSMDTTFIEMVLQELDETRHHMKTLRSKYDQVKRASQYAVQGFDHAKSEYDAQRQARSDTEVEMLRLKGQLAEQASKLAALAHQEKRQETLDRRSKDVRKSLQDVAKDLAKLTVERDMKAAEVAELIAVQEGRTPLPTVSEDASCHEADNVIPSRLSLRLDGIKERYREEIEQLTNQRNQLLIEIEDLRQSRDVYLEETETLNTRNEELNVLLSKLSAKVESLSMAEHSSSASSRQSSRSAGTVGWSGTGVNNASKTAGFGFGFSTRGSRGHAASASVASSRDGFTIGSSTGVQPAAEADPYPMSAPPRGAINLPPQAAAQTRAEAAALASMAPYLATSLPSGMSSSAPGSSAANPKKFKWMKPISSSKHHAPHASTGSLVGQSPPVPPPKSGHSGHAAGLSASNVQLSTALSQRDREVTSHEQIVREHVFLPFNVLRPTRCFACQKNMWGQSEVRCASCGQVCHSKCLSSLPISCTQPYLGKAEEIGFEPAGPPMFGRHLLEQAAAEGRDVPMIVEKCIRAVEKNGMDYEGIYRKSGGTSQLRVITQLFERGGHFDLDDVERFNDVSAVTSVLKNYFRELPEPLMTFNLHEGFIKCVEQFKTSKAASASLTSLDASSSSNGGAENGSNTTAHFNGIGADVATVAGGTSMEDAKLQRMRELVNQLPRAHFETLKLLIGHLSQVARYCEENRMTPRNLGVVFGPTLMRSPDPLKEFSEMGGKSLTVEYLCERYSDVFSP